MPFLHPLLFFSIVIATFFYFFYFIYTLPLKSLYSYCPPPLLPTFISSSSSIHILSCTHFCIILLNFIAGESVGPKAVVGQQTYEAPPSNSDVAGLSGGIRAAGPRPVKPGKLKENFVILDVVCAFLNVCMCNNQTICCEH